MKTSVACLCVIALAIASPPTHAAEDAEPAQVIQSTYVCERGATIPVTYINVKSGESFAVAEIEGRQVTMAIAPSGSGARYVAVNEQESYRWRIKGNEGTLSFLEAGHEAEERTLLAECKVQPKADNSKQAPKPKPPAIGIANPASTYCVGKGGKLEIRNEKTGAVGYCHLPDGRVIEEWKFFRSENK